MANFSTTLKRLLIRKALNLKKEKGTIGNGPDKHRVGKAWRR